MLSMILYKVPNWKFLLYVFLLYVVAATSNSLFTTDADTVALLPIVLMPFAQVFFLLGVKKRWPEMLLSMACASTGLWIGAIVYAFQAGYF